MSDQAILSLSPTV